MLSLLAGAWRGSGDLVSSFFYIDLLVSITPIMILIRVLRSLLVTEILTKAPHPAIEGSGFRVLRFNFLSCL